MNASARLPAPATVARGAVATDAWVRCPACGDIASVEWRADVAGAEHVKVRCLHRHWFLLLAESLTAAPTADG